MSDQLPAVPSDVHYEVALDPEPGSMPAVPVDPAPVPGERLPIFPPQIGKTVTHHAGRLAYSTAVHGVRSPWYLLLMVFWAIVGAGKLAWRRIHWWQVLEQEKLRNELAAAGDRAGYMAVQKNGQEARKVRSIILGCCLLLVVIGVVVVVNAGYGWTLWFGLLLVPWLARHGHPADKPIVRPVIVTPRFRKLSADIVLRAYYAAGLGHAEKPDQQVTFGSTMRRDGEGSRVLVDLPYGKSLKDAVLVKDAIASGLDVTESQVYLHRDPTSARRHTLWVADRDPLAVPVGRTPLLACKQTDIWKPAPLGLDERGQLVTVPLMWHSLLVGALPRQGKTFTARSLGLYAALDPYVKVSVFDAAGKPDWRKFALVADSCAFGLTPTKDGLPPEILLQALEELRRDVEDRYHELSKLADKNPAICPEGKLTRQLARDKRFGMPVRMLLLDEVQEYFDLGDISKEIAKLLVFLVKVAPGAGVILADATQKPSGIGGAGFTGTQFISFRDQHALRFSLRTGSRDVSENVLGAGALGEGLNSSKLLPEYKGVGILRHASDKSPTVRTFLADGQDADKILTAARGIRERAGTLSGMALGGTTLQAPSILTDVLSVLGDETAMQWQALAQVLRERFPERYNTGCTPESVSAQCRGLGVPSVDVLRMGRTLMGCRREHIEAALSKEQS